MDIDWYFYIAKCVLGYSSKEAWRLTIRQIAAMVRQHNRYHGADREAPEEYDGDD